MDSISESEQAFGAGAIETLTDVSVEENLADGDLLTVRRNFQQHQRQTDHGRAQMPARRHGSRSNASLPANKVSFEDLADCEQANSGLPRTESLADLIHKHGRKASLDNNASEHTCTVCDSDSEPAARPKRTSLLPKIFALDKGGNINELAATPDHLRPARAGVIGSRSCPVVVLPDNQKPGLLARLKCQQRLRALDPKRSVAFHDECEVQVFDAAAPVSHAVCTEPTFEPVCERSSVLRESHRWPSSKAGGGATPGSLRNCGRRDTIQLRFREARSSDHYDCDGCDTTRGQHRHVVSHEFLSPVQIPMGHARCFDDLAGGLVNPDSPDLDNGYDPPSWVRFRLVQLDRRGRELVDSKDYLRVGALKKWLPLERDSDWAIQHVEREYAKFLTCLSMARTEYRQQGVAAGLAWRVRDGLKLSMGLGTGFEVGDEIRARLRARRVHPIVEFLWDA